MVLKYKFWLFFLDGVPEGLNLKTYPNEQTIKESKHNLSSLLYSYII